jgi:beta-lactamase superfamily II metal-dependent hydrolase
MKRKHLLLLSLLLALALMAGTVETETHAQEAPPALSSSFTIPRQPGTFEIHVFDVEQGDSQLVLFPSGYSILIDLSEPSWNSGKGATLVAEKIRTLTGGSHINVAVLTHLHLDHIGYAGYGGFWALLEEEGISFDRVIDRDAGTWVDGSGGGTADGACDPDTEIEWHNAGTLSNTARRWLCYATHPANSKIYAVREVAQVGSTTQIDPPDAGARVEIIEADAQGVLMVDGVTPVPGDHTADPLPPSENDYSIALKISFGEIDYATAGDTDGEYATSSWGYTYNDVESVIADRFGPVELLHVNHHGSSHSSNATYVAALDPEVSLISCGHNGYGHPDQVVLDRLTATGQVYLTNFCDETRDYGGTIIANGDIVIRSQDGLTYEVLVPRRILLPLVVAR